MILQEQRRTVVHAVQQPQTSRSTFKLGGRFDLARAATYRRTCSTATSTPAVACCRRFYLLSDQLRPHLSLRQQIYQRLYIYHISHSFGGRRSAHGLCLCVCLYPSLFNSAVKPDSGEMQVCFILRNTKRYTHLLYLIQTVLHMPYKTSHATKRHSNSDSISGYPTDSATDAAISKHKAGQ